MAKREQLRSLRKGTVINVNSSKMEKELTVALKECENFINSKYEVTLEHVSQVFLSEITELLSRDDQITTFDYHKDSSTLRPDGGILFIKATDGKRFPILISEAKRQGTNDDRALEGLKKQAKGNAIERLGKNVIGFRAMCVNESIFPFVVFGQGIDFEEGSSILDRVSVIALFNPLNRTSVLNEGMAKNLQRGSFYFRVNKWTVDEMAKILVDISTQSIEYYFGKYGKKYFLTIGK
jgi:type II restriction enzyme